MSPVVDGDDVGAGVVVVVAPAAAGAAVVSAPAGEVCGYFGATGKGYKASQVGAALVSGVKILRK